MCQTLHKHIFAVHQFSPCMGMSLHAPKSLHLDNKHQNLLPNPWVLHRVKRFGLFKMLLLN